MSHVKKIKFEMLHLIAALTLFMAAVLSLAS